MSAPQQRPRVVTVAFWCWVVAAVTLMMLGLLSLSAANVPPLIRGAGAVFFVAAAALAYLSGRTGRGDRRFRRATVGLSLALVALLALYTLISSGIAWALPMVLILVAAVLVMRPSAEPWFTSEDGT